MKRYSFIITFVSDSGRVRVIDSNAVAKDWIGKTTVLFVKDPDEGTRVYEFRRILVLVKCHTTASIPKCGSFSVHVLMACSSYRVYRCRRGEDPIGAPKLESRY
jgi:hypothetical protein